MKISHDHSANKVEISGKKRQLENYHVLANDKTDL